MKKLIFTLSLIITAYCVNAQTRYILFVDTTLTNQVSTTPLPTVAIYGRFSDLKSKPTTTTGYGITDAVPTARTLTINGVTYDLTSNRSWAISAKRQETYSGTTNSSGNYTVTFGTAYTVAPNIQANITAGTNTNLIKITSVIASGFTVNVVNRTDVIGLLPTYSNVTGATVDVLITEK